MTLGPHADFIVLAYVIAVAVTAAMIAWVFLDYRRQRRLLAELEARGVTRRSAAAREPAATALKEPA